PPPPAPGPFSRWQTHVSDAGRIYRTGGRPDAGRRSALVDLSSCDGRVGAGIDVRHARTNHTAAKEAHDANDLAPSEGGGRRDTCRTRPRGASPSRRARRCSSSSRPKRVRLRLLLPDPNNWRIFAMRLFIRRVYAGSADMSVLAPK